MDSANHRITHLPKSYAKLWRELGLRLPKAPSVIATGLIGASVTGLSSRSVVLFAQLFGIPEGTVRVTLSRMVSAGRLEVDNGHYRLAGEVLKTHGRNQQKFMPRLKDWNGRFVIEVVCGDPRSARQRMEFRSAMSSLHISEYREGVWMRPDNLEYGPNMEAVAVVRQQCERFVVTSEGEPAAVLVRKLWDIKAWQHRAEQLRTALSLLGDDIASSQPQAVALGYMLIASIEQHLLADPLLPPELLPPTWPGRQLRRESAQFDAGWQKLLVNWLRSECPSAKTSRNRKIDGAITVP